MTRRIATRRRRATLAIAVLLGGGLMLPSASPAAAAPSPAGANEACAPVMPLADVEAGQVGTGWTVVKGTTPRSFRVAILGVYADGIAPGKDMIMVEVSDLAGQHVVDAGDGIWSGMSGSPVYVGGRLVGAVAYGFSAGPSTIGGLSPATDMMRLLSLPSPTAAAALAGSARSSRTHLSTSLRRALAQATGRSVAVSGDFDRLALPISVSGVGARGRALLGERLAAAGISARITRGASVATPAGGLVTPRPGGNFAAAVSYGDVTVAGVGTTTWVCGDRALAFGHPLALNGPATFGASAARSLAIVKDPTAGAFKLATLGAPFGVVDQDRLSGIRADLEALPRTYPVIAVIRDLDLGSTRSGRTDVTAADWMAYIAPQHVYADMIAATDREGPGTAALRLTIEGRRADGSPWSVVVGDRVVNSGTIQLQAAIAVDNVVYRIASNEAEDVRITRVHLRASVQQTVRTASIARVRVSRNGGPFQAVEELQVRAGDALRVRVALRDRSGTLRFVSVPLTVPADADGFGTLVVAGGSSLGSSCEFDPSACGGSSFGALLRQIAQAPRGDELVVELDLEGPDGPRAVAVAKVRQPDVVTGYETISVVVR